MDILDGSDNSNLDDSKDNHSIKSETSIESMHVNDKNVNVPLINNNNEDKDKDKDKDDKIIKKSLSQIKTIFPIDAKLLQYCYLCRKTVAMIVIIKKLKDSLINNSIQLVDPQSIILLSGAIFNINDNFYRRSEILQNLQKYNPSQTINLPLILLPISFDSLENISRNSPIGPYGISFDKLIPLPNKKKILDTIILLELLLLNVYEILNSRFNIALNQLNNQHNTIETKQSIIKKLDNIQFNELNLINKLTFSNLPINLSINQKDNILMYYLKNQFNFLKIKLLNYQNIIDDLKLEINNSINSVSNLKLNKFPILNNSIPLFTMYSILLRIADLYIEIRKMGKTIYFQNINYFSPYIRYRKGVKNALLEMSIYFTHSKQNNMILTLISKYAKRSEIKNLNLDFDLFLFDFKKISIEMINLLNRMLKSLKDLHDEFTLIINEGKENEFNKDILKEKLKEKIQNERNLKNKLLIEKQNKDKKNLEYNNTKNKLIARRVSSINSLNSINENNESNEINGMINHAKLRRASISNSRSPSLTIKSQSQLKSNSVNNSRSNSLTIKSISRRSSVNDFKNNSEISSISESSTFIEPPKIGHNIQRKASYGSLTSNSSSRSSSLTRQSTNRGIRSSSLTNKNIQTLKKLSPVPSSPSNSPSPSNSLTSSPITTKTSIPNVNSRSSSITRKTSINNLRRNSLTSLPNKDLLTRKSSTITPKSSSDNLKNQANTDAHRSANTATVRRRLSINTLPVSKSNENKNDTHIKAAALAAKRNSIQNLTAQQRLQQHILKSTQNGSVYSKPLQNSRRSYVSKTSSPVKANINNTNGNNIVDLTKTLDEKLLDSSSDISNDNSISQIISPRTINNDSNNNKNDNNSNDSDTSSEFPGSPLNSLKNTSLEAQNALKLQMAYRSRSNSNTNVSNTPSLKPKSNINNGSSLSPSPSRVRSRSNSTLNKLSRQQSIDSNGSVSDLSRRNSISSLVHGKNRSRSSSVIGNMDVVSENEIENNHQLGPDGEIIKKVRFTGVSQYSEDEDAPTPQRIQKQIKQKWAAYKPLFRKLNSQEGLVFKQNHEIDINNNSNNSNNGNLQKKNYGGGLVTGSMNSTYGGIGINPNMIMAAQGATTANNTNNTNDTNYNNYGNGKVMMMNLITSNTENEAAQNMSSKTLRRERKSIIGNGGEGNGNNATNRLSRLFRKR